MCGDWLPEELSVYQEGLARFLWALYKMVIRDKPKEFRKLVCQVNNDYFNPFKMYWCEAGLAKKKKMWYEKRKPGMFYSVNKVPNWDHGCGLRRVCKEHFSSQDREQTKNKPLLTITPTSMTSTTLFLG